MADSELTKRQQETFNAIKSAGKKGILFEALRAKLGVASPGTLRPRIAALTKCGKVTSTKNGRTATYTAK